METCVCVRGLVCVTVFVILCTYNLAPILLSLFPTHHLLIQVGFGQSKRSEIKANFKCSPTPLSGRVFLIFIGTLYCPGLCGIILFFVLFVHSLFRLFWYLHASSCINANASKKERERESVLMMKSCLQFLLGKKLRTENVTGWLNDKFARLS